MNSIEMASKCSESETRVYAGSLTEETNKPIDRWSNLKRSLGGISLGVLSALFLTLGAVIIKHVNEISVGEMSLYRYVVLLVFSFSLLLETRGVNWLGPSSWNWRLWMLIRSVAGCTNLFFHYSAVKYISLADTTTICLWTPVVVFIFARLFLKEPFGRWHLLALVVSSVGVALASKIHLDIINGTLFSSKGSSENRNNSLTNCSMVSPEVIGAEVDQPHRRLIGIAYCLGSVFVASIVLISLRKIRNTHHSVLLFYFSAISIVETSVINAVFFQFRLPINGGYTPYLIILLGVCAFFGQLFLTKAVQLEEAGIVSVVRSSSEAVFAFTFQVILFKEPLDMYSVCGALLVISAILLLSFRKYVIGLPAERPLRQRFKWLE